jgi:hypothetical protein
MERDDFFWLVGLIEGEGCFTLVRRNENTTYMKHYVRIVITMTDEDVIARAARIMGRKYRKLKRTSVPSHYKDKWAVELNGQAAVDFAAAVLPHMGNRRQYRIREVLSRTHQTPNPGRSRR